jgi:DNA-binding NarL/FixJ family response regulator
MGCFAHASPLLLGIKYHGGFFMPVCLTEGEGMDKLRVLVAENHPLLREMIERLLGAEASLEVIGAVDNGVEALRAARELAPEMVLMDINLPAQGGLAVTRSILEDRADTAIFLLVDEDNEEYRTAATELGAVLCLSKSTVDRELLPAIRRELVERGSQ